jgi:hypothetical protein
MKTMTGTVERKQFFKLHEEGQTYADIAELFGVSAMCVRFWCRRLRAGGGVENGYHNPRRGSLSQFDPRLPAQVLALRRAHPHWGPESLLLHLRQDGQFADPPLPSRASLARFLHGFGEFRRGPKKKSR